MGFPGVVFMALAGTSFALHYKVVRRDWKAYFKSVELRAYLAIVLIAATLMAIGTWGGAVATTIRDSIFTALTIVTTTGSGDTARLVARLRPSTPVLAMTTSVSVARQLNLSWGVVSATEVPTESTEELGHAMMLDHHWLDAATIVESWLQEQGI